MKKSKLMRSLPLDCVGEILTFIKSPKIFFNIYIISKDVIWYINNENPFSCQNVIFVYNMKVKMEKNLPYVVYLCVAEYIDLSYFPNCKTIHYLGDCCALESNILYKQFGKLKYLDTYIANNSQIFCTNWDHIYTYKIKYFAAKS